MPEQINPLPAPTTPGVGNYYQSLACVPLDSLVDTRCPTLVPLQEGSWQSGQHMAPAFSSPGACLTCREQPGLAFFQPLSPVAAGRLGLAPLCVTL